MHCSLLNDFWIVTLYGQYQNFKTYSQGCLCIQFKMSSNQQNLMGIDQNTDDEVLLAYSGLVGVYDSNEVEFCVLLWC